MKPTQALLVLLCAGAFAAAPSAYAKNDGLLGHGNGHAGTQQHATTGNVSGNVANHDPHASSTASAHAGSSASASNACDDGSSSSLSSAIGGCDSHDAGNTDSSGDSRPSLGWQSLLPGSIQ